MPARGEQAQGERQFGPYRLSQLIATGGMAEIHLARTRGIEGFEKYVALKMIHPNFSSDDHFIQMLIDEAKISVQLQHVNIAHTFDLGRVGDTYYIAMEFVDGSDLFRILRKASEQDRYMPIETAVYIAKEVAAGLDYAHRKRDASGRSMGIVHRDVSPQNVLISHAGEVKIVDFGIAKATMRAKQTAVGVIKGKYFYMSPEQAWGDPVDHRTDIFSAGILLYEMLTGQMLYLEEDMTKLLEMVRRADIPPPSSKRREVPRELDRIVMRALAKKPDLRWQSAQDYGTELEKFLHGFAPDFTTSRLSTFVAEVLPPPPPPAPAPAPAPAPPIVAASPSPRVTRGIERRSIVLSRSEFTDENSVIFNAALGEHIVPPSRSADRMTMPSAKPPPRVSRPMEAQRPDPPPPRLSRPIEAQQPRLSRPIEAQPSPRPPEVPPPRPAEPPPPRLSRPIEAQQSPRPAAVTSPKPVSANRLTTPGGILAPPRPPPPPTLPPPEKVVPLAARLAGTSQPQPPPPVVDDRGTIDIDDVDLEPVDEPDEDDVPTDEPRSLDSTAEIAAPPSAAAHEPPADEEPTVLDVAALAGRSRPSGPRPAVAAPSAGRISETRPIEPQPAAAPPPVAAEPAPPPPSPRPSKRTPAAVPILASPEPPPAQPQASALPLAAPVESAEERAVSSSPSARGAAQSVWPPQGTIDGDEGDDLFGFRIGGRVNLRQLVLGLFILAVAVGLGALGVAVFSQRSAPAYATVDVISIPSKARVLVDGRELGITPLTLDQVALNRPFKLRVELPQHEAWERPEQLTEARHVKVVASLKAIVGTLRVDSNPVGAEVFVNNRSVGTTPLQRTDLSPFVDGTVEVRKQGFKPSRQTLEWKGGREVKLSFELVAAKE